MLKGLEGTKYESLPPVHKWTPPFCGDMNLSLNQMAIGFMKVVK